MAEHECMCAECMLKHCVPAKVTIYAHAGWYLGAGSNRDVKRQWQLTKYSLLFECSVAKLHHNIISCCWVQVQAERGGSSGGSHCVSPPDI